MSPFDAAETSSIGMAGGWIGHTACQSSEPWPCSEVSIAAAVCGSGWAPTVDKAWPHKSWSHAAASAWQSGWRQRCSTASCGEPRAGAAAANAEVWCQQGWLSESAKEGLQTVIKRFHHAHRGLRAPADGELTLEQRLHDPSACHAKDGYPRAHVDAALGAQFLL